MTSPTPAQPIFDGHNDALLRLYNYRGGDPVQVFLEGKERGHIDLPKARTGGLAGGLFAIFVPSENTALPALDASAGGGAYDVPLPPGVPLASAQAATLAMASILFRIEAASNGAVKVCRSAAAIQQRWSGR